MVFKKYFIMFFLADIVSGFGVGMSTIGANWYLLDETGSSTAIGIMLTLNVLAGFIVSPLTGTITDKFNRKNVIQGTFIFRAVLISTLTILFITDGFSIYYIYTFAIINGIGWSVYMSASRSLIQELLSESELSRGNSLIEISLQVGMFMAGAASGFIYKFIGFEAILGLNALMFVVSSILMVFVKYQSINLDLNEEGYIISFTKGLEYLNTHRLIFLLGIVSIIPLISTMIYNVVLPGYVNYTLNAESIVFGFSDMCYGIGGLLSGFIAAPFAKRLSKNKAVATIFILAFFTLLGLAANTYVFIIYVGSFIIGLSNSSLRIIMNTMLMEVVPKKLMGRALSVWMGIALFFQALLGSGLGFLIDLSSPSMGFVSMGLLMLIGLTLKGFVSRKSNKRKVYKSYEVI